MLERRQYTRLRQLCSFLTLCCLHSLSWGSNLPQHSPVPGGVALITLPSGFNPQTPVYYGAQRVLVVPGPELAVAVIGIPLSAKPGTATIHLNQPKGESITFKIEPKTYAEQRITLENKRQVNPYEKDMARILEDKKTIQRTFAHWRQESPTLLFQAPVKGVLSSPFGLRRFFNDQARSPHSGIDIAAAEGTPLLAPADGIISTIGDFFFNGNTIFIDHGQGVISMMCHLQQVHVSEGQRVLKGEVIGAVGMTGRVTGPHVHWGLSLNNTRVDPRLFYAQ